MELSRRIFLAGGAGLGAKVLLAQGTPLADIRLIVLAQVPIRIE
jgi:hypothetical protein